MSEEESSGCMRKLASLLLFLSVSTSLHAQWFDWKSPLVPRTADGRPDTSTAAPRTADGSVDLSGLWVSQEARGSLFEESSILGWALEAMDEAERSFYATDPRFHCLPSGPSAYLAGPRRILQRPDIIAILNPDMTYREIFMDGRELEAEPLLPTWMGYSVGRWDGDTLVVESNGYNDKTWLTREGLPHSTELRITERYTRLDYGRMTLEITYEDPRTFARPAEATVDLTLQPDGAMLEVVCSESETGQRHYSGEMSQSEQKVVEVPQEVLEKYVGTYRGVWLGSRITAEVTLENGELFLKRTPRYSTSGGNVDYDTSRLIPQSENAFDSSFGLGWIFNVNADGEVTSVSEVHVSGAWPFARVE
jgi:hypothetical protein